MQKLFYFLGLVPTPVYAAIGGYLGTRGERLRKHTWAILDLLCSSFRRYILRQRARTVLIWSDDLGGDRCEGCARGICEWLSGRLGKTKFRCLKSPYDVLGYWLFPNNTRAVVLIDTDVTQFHFEKKVRTGIGTYLLKYVRNGGVLVAVHDVLYRRTRNDLLVDAYHYEVSSFRRLPEGEPLVKYKKATECPDTWKGEGPYEIDAGEFLWDPNKRLEEMDKDDRVDLILEVDQGKCKGKAWAEEYRIPGLFSRRYGKGRLVWVAGPCQFVNAGAPPGLNRTMDAFCKLLVDCLEYCELTKEL